MFPMSPTRIVIFMACRPPDRPNEASRKSELGLIKSVWRRPSHFRFIPHSRHSLGGSAGPFRANAQSTEAEVAPLAE